MDAASLVDDVIWIVLPVQVLKGRVEYIYDYLRGYAGVKIVRVILPVFQHAQKDAEAL